MQNQYLQLYSKLNDSIKRSEKLAIIEESKHQIRKSVNNARNDYSNKLRLVLIFSFVIAGLVIFVMWLFFLKKNNANKNNYNLLIDKIKKNHIENQIPEQNDDNPGKGTEADQESKTKISISTDTERKILKKLEVFEESNRFLKKDISLTSLAHQQGTNPKYLSEIIRIHKSQNFNGYINKLRIDYIVKKLYESPKYREYKISYLASECGYASPQVFVIAFKKETGVTPSYFIERLIDYAE
ncbi:MAG: hypothetical protein DI535_27855 [Citrobacter freundii]|nr:MAG: hypothetical protein DI535_27855 [Citrobacter freundii]